MTKPSLPKEALPRKLINYCEWLNTRDLYVDYCHISEIPKKCLALIENYGKFFDDEYSYWQPKRRKGTVLLPLIKRRPIWMLSKRMPAEKFHMHIDAKKLSQTKLLEVKEGEKNR